MNRPSAFQLAFSAFRPPIEPEIIRRAVVAIAAQGLLVTALFGLSAASYAELLTAMSSGDPPPTGSPAQMQANLASLLSLAAWPFWAAVEAASLRWFLYRERTGGPLALRFGADELRVMLVHAALFGLFFILYLAAIVPIFVAALLTALSPAVGIGLIACIALALTVGLAFVFARLAPSAALTIRDRKFGLPRAWAGTKGQSLRVIGAYVLLYLPYMLVIGIGSVLALATIVGGAPSPTAVMGGWIEALRAPGPGLYLGFLVYGLATGALAYILYLGGYAISAGVARDIPPPEAQEAPVSAPTSP